MSLTHVVLLQFRQDAKPDDVKAVRLTSDRRVLVRRFNPPSLTLAISGLRAGPGSQEQLRAPDHAAPLYRLLEGRQGQLHRGVAGAFSL